MDTPPSISTLLRVFGRIGLLSFGGPAAQIALMHRDLVERHKWLSEKDFLSALSFCMLLPGPEAMQLATYCGWRLRGQLGGLIAGLLFVLPGALVIWALALGYAHWGAVPLVQSVFLGIKATVVVIVLQALVNMARKNLKTLSLMAMAALSFVGIYVFDVPFPAIILIAGVWGAVTARGTDQPAQPLPPSRGTARTVAVWSALWALPMAVVWATDQRLLLDLAQFFSTLAVVTFGGAYAVLAYMTQAVVQDFGWLSASEMVDALGLAETTPGPLILVTEFVGILAGHKAQGPWFGTLAGAIVLWVTFVPCFLWIFTGAPYLSWLSSRPRVSAALTGISAAVVGVIFSLSLWFALLVFFGESAPLHAGPVVLELPVLASFQPLALLYAGVAAGLIWGLGRSVLTSLLCVSTLSLIIGLVT